MDWNDIQSPSLEDFETLAREAFDALPAEFRALTGQILFRIEDFPDEDVIEDMELQSAFDILGLFAGPRLADHEAGAVHGTQTMIFLYRRPILDYWAEHRESLGAIVRHVLIHEIGHHFGLSDEDMEGIEEASE